MLELRKRADKSGDPPAEGRPWPLKHVELVGEAPKEHNFSDDFVNRALAEGWLMFKNERFHTTETTRPYSRGIVATGDQIVLHLKGGNLTYDVLESPGRYWVDEKKGIDREEHEYKCKLATKAKR